MTRRTAGRATAALISGGIGVAAFGLGAGIAQAEDPYYGSTPSFGTWCPGQPVPGSFTQVNWDWNVCHDYTTVSRYHPDGRHLFTIKGLRTRDSVDGDWYLVAGEDNTPVNCEVFVPGRNDPRCALG